jgi:hypothetical protein
MRNGFFRSPATSPDMDDDGDELLLDLSRLV